MYNRPQQLTRIYDSISENLVRYYIYTADA